MSAQQRAELTESLKQFELRLPPDQQNAIRDLDRQLNDLPPEDKVRYLTALRRYHNWLDSLPETVRDNLQAKPPGERMAQIKTLLSRYPLPSEVTPEWMQFADVAGIAPFELAAIIKAWQQITPKQRQEVEAITGPVQRRLKLMEYAREAQWPRELRPPDFHVEDYVSKVEARIAEVQTVDPELKAALDKAEKAAAEKAEKNGAGKSDTAKRKIEARVKTNRFIFSPLLRRLAINVYYLEHPPRPVDSDHLAQFFAAMPPWIRPSFNAYPPDEARRRLTIIYRLLYPDSEFGARKPETEIKGQISPPPAPTAPPRIPAKERPKDAGNSPF